MIFTHVDIDAYSALTGDRNPIHLDDAAAQSVGFSGRIVQGMLALSRMQLARHIEAIFRKPLFPGISYNHYEHDEPGRNSIGTDEVISMMVVTTNWNVEFKDDMTGGLFDAWGVYGWQSSGWLPYQGWKDGVLGCCSYLAGQKFRGIIASITLDFHEYGYGDNLIYAARCENVGSSFGQRIRAKFMHGDKTCALATITTVSHA